MPIIEVSEAQAGSVLAQPVHSPRGILLAPEGARLSETHLTTFASWGVRFIDVIGDARSEEAPLDEALVEAVRAQLDERFAPAQPLSPLMREVRQAAEQIVLQREARAASGEGGPSR